MDKSYYFKNLSKTRSGNFLAMLGLLMLSYTSLGAVSRFIQAVFFHKMYIGEIIDTFYLEAMWYLPIYALFSLILTVVMFVFLYKPFMKLKYQLVIMTAIILYLIKDNFIACSYSTGNAILFLLGIFSSPLLLVYFLIFFFLMRRDLKKPPNFANHELVNNKSYAKLVQILYWYTLFVSLNTGIWLVCLVLS